jgi:hypothetical protein
VGEQHVRLIVRPHGWRADDDATNATVVSSLHEVLDGHTIDQLREWFEIVEVGHGGRRPLPERALREDSRPSAEHERLGGPLEERQQLGDRRGLSGTNRGCEDCRLRAGGGLCQLLGL